MDTEKDHVPRAEEPLVPPSPPAMEELAAEGAVAVGQPAVGQIPGRETADRVRALVVYAALLALALLFLVPFFWTVTTSLKTLPETALSKLFPEDPTLKAYREAWTTFNFARYTANSAGLAAAVTAGNLFLASLGGYAFARLRFPGREVLFMVVLSTLMIPDQLRLVPVFQMLTNWHLIGHYHGYVLIKLGAATELFLMRQYFLSIPRDLEEAAKLDGAGYFKTFWKVMLPIAAPALAAVTILQFQGTWNDFFWQLIVFLGEDDHYTLPVGIAEFSFQYQTNWPPLMAASVIAITPIALLYVFFQRYFVAGIAAAGVKG
jgi:multiple sugar transport system permease protein